MKNLQPHIEGKKHVIWDWNGTLLSDLDHAVAITNRLLCEEGLTPITAEIYRRKFRFPVYDYYVDVGFPKDEKKFVEICERFNRHFHEGLANCELFPGARETLRGIRDSGKTQSILSATFQDLLFEQVRLLGIEGYFHHLAGLPDKAASSKVARGQLLMSAAGIAPEHTIMIGDTDHDGEVANALGIDVLLVEHGHQHVDRLKATNFRVVKVF